MQRWCGCRQQGSHACLGLTEDIGSCRPAAALICELGLLSSCGMLMTDLQQISDYALACIRPWQEGMSRLVGFQRACLSGDITSLSAPEMPDFSGERYDQTPSSGAWLLGRGVVFPSLSRSAKMMTSLTTSCTMTPV